MPMRGIPAPVLAISLVPNLGDGFVGLSPPFGPRGPGDSGFLESDRPALTFHTPTDLLAESRWVEANRKLWNRYVIAKPLGEVKLAPGYKFRFDGLTLEEILDGKLVDMSHTPPLRAAEALLIAWQSAFPNPSDVADAHQIDALIERSCETLPLRAETRDLDLALALLETPESIPLGLLGFVAKELVRAGKIEAAVTMLTPSTDPDALVLAADLAMERDRPIEAADSVATAVARKVDVLGGVERMQRWRRATLGAGARSTICVTLDGHAWRVCFRPRAIVGRADADIVIPAPMVSRRQLEIFLLEGIPRIIDAESRHGTFVQGLAISGLVSIRAPLEIMIGRAVRCSLVPDQNGQLIVEAPSGRHMLSFGETAHLEGWTLMQSGRRLAVAKEGAAIRIRGDLAFTDLHDVCEPRTLESSDGHELVIEADSFEL